MYDVVLVGGGVSSLSVLVKLAQRRVLPPGARVALVDPDGETGGGAAYARGVHPALLLNDRSQKIDRTGIGFGAWVAENSTSVLDELADHDDDRVRQWLRWYGPQLAQGDVTELYLPRIVFGRFARLRFEDTRRTLAEQGVAVDVLRARVDDVEQTTQGWRLELAPARTVHARAVVLGIGGAIAPAASTHRRYLLGRPGLDLDAVERAVAAAEGRDVLLLGSAASAVEAVYCIEGNRRLRSAFSRIVSISPSGRLPDGLGSEVPASFAVDALNGTVDTADALLQDLATDVRRAREMGLRMPDAYPPLHGGFTTRFRRMSEAEKKRLTDVHVPAYLSLVRRTSTVYAGGAERLLARGQLAHVAGRVHGVEAGDDEVRVTLQDGRVLVGAVALDCRGFGKSSEVSLLTPLMAAGAVEQNDSNMSGVRVNAGLEAAPGLLVLGPLLAGTPRVGTDHIWHLEDIPRIYELAADVVGTLDDVLSTGRRVDELAFAGTPAPVAGLAP